MNGSKIASPLPTNTKQKPYYQPTIPLWYNASWHTGGNALNWCSHIHNDKKRWIDGFANLVHAGGTGTIMCYAHSLRGKIVNNYHHPLGDWKE